MPMPWPVKIVWWWYLTLACASCVPLVICLVKADFLGRGELFQLLTGTASWAAYFAGLALAVRRGRRGWATVPYGVVGLLMIMIGWEGALRYGLTLKTGLFLFVSAALTVFPIALLHLPSSKVWFQRWPRPKRLGVGCGWLFGVFVVGLLVSFIEFAPSPEVRVIAANTSAMAIRGRHLFCALAENEIARQSGGCWVDPTACSNSVEFIEKLLVQYRPDEKTEWVRKESRRWSVAVNVPESATNFPVFVSANLDPSQFPCAWDGVTDADRKFELAQLPGADEFRIGKKAVVIVRKGGASSVYKAKYCKLKHIFNCPYELGEDTYFLTPAGKVWPKGTGGVW